MLIGFILPFNLPTHTHIRLTSPQFSKPSRGPRSHNENSITILLAEQVRGREGGREEGGGEGGKEGEREGGREG